MNTILTTRQFELFKLVLVSFKKLTMRDGWRPEEASYQLLAIWLYGTHSWILKMLISFDAKFRDESIAVKQYLFYKRLEPLMTIWMSNFLSWRCFRFRGGNLRRKRGSLGQAHRECSGMCTGVKGDPTLWMRENSNKNENFCEC